MKNSAYGFILTFLFLSSSNSFADDFLAQPFFGISNLDFDSLEKAGFKEQSGSEVHTSYHKEFSLYRSGSRLSLEKGVQKINGKVSCSFSQGFGCSTTFAGKTYDGRPFHIKGSSRDYLLVVQDTGCCDNDRYSAVVLNSHLKKLCSKTFKGNGSSMKPFNIDRLVQKPSNHLKFTKNWFWGNGCEIIK